MAVTGLCKPDFRTIAKFGCRHLAALSELFRQVLELCREAGLVKLGHVALDGTKIKANASKHKAMSYGRMKQREDELAAEVRRWLQQAEATDAGGRRRFGADRRGDELPDGCADQAGAAAKIRRAKAELEAEAQREAAAEQPARAKVDEKPPRRPAPAAAPDAKAQRNFTDPESRILKTKDGYIQGYNAQAAVDAHAQIIVAHTLGNNRQRSGAVRSAARCHQGQSGQQSARSIGRCRLLLGRQSSHARAGDGSKATSQPDDKSTAASSLPRSGRPNPARFVARMTSRLRRAGHRSRYRLRKQVVEPVFGQIKQATGFRQFLLRGIEKVEGRMGDDLHRP